jgi:glutamine---fructose-6-phosphate transaminase (isomerizing)
MTHFLQDILRQPGEIRRAIEYLSGTGRRPMQMAAAAVRAARHVYVTGIGSSWHAALSVAPLFHAAAGPVCLQDASELLQFASLPPDAVVIAISRSGRSVEIVELLRRTRESGATIIGITNTAEGRLAQEANFSILVPVKLDHAISVNTYSTLAAAAGALACSVSGSFDAKLCASLQGALAETERRLPGWRAQISGSDWLRPHKATYFLARGGSLGSSYEARLLWEEGAKSPATAMGTGSFRHGPQEIVSSDIRFGVWIDTQRMRAQDFSVVADLSRLGAAVMLIGQEVPPQAGDLVFQIPNIPSEWQFLIDIVPAQLAAEALAQRQGVDADSFRVCSYIVDDEYGLIGAEVAARKHEG